MANKQKVLELDQEYNIQVTGRHVQVTEAMKNYAIEKISKLERIASRIIEVSVTMDIQKLEQRVDIVMKYGHTIFKSTASTTDMYVSIDQAVDKLETQIKRYLNRIHDHHAKSHAQIEMTETVYGPAIFEEDIEEVNSAIEKETQKQKIKEFAPHQIVKTETQPLKILTDQEAIIKMDFSSAPVMVYRCDKDRKLKVIYRRADGNYGVVQPE
jgi:putative sigma-54 modulation protein